MKDHGPCSPQWLWLVRESMSVYFYYFKCCYVRSDRVKEMNATIFLPVRKITNTEIRKLRLLKLSAVWSFQSCSISQETPENIHQLFESVVVKGWLSKVTKKLLWVISSRVFRHDCFWKTENHISHWPPNLCICMHLTSNAFIKWSIVQVRSPKQEKTPKELEEMLS